MKLNIANICNRKKSEKMANEINKFHNFIFNEINVEINVIG